MNRRLWLNVGSIVLALTAAVLLERAGLGMQSLPLLPVEDWSQSLIEWLNNNLSPLFTTIDAIISGVINPIQAVLTSTPPLAVLVAAAALGWLRWRWTLGAFVAAALFIIGGMGYWEEAMITLSLVLSATIFALLIGVPVGLAKAHSRWLDRMLDPVLDLMQTMPLFVYLIPAVLFFSIGNVPGVVATIIFSMPPAVRLTGLGIEQIPEELSEAGRSFGANWWQTLTKVEIPLALPSIMMGVNQTIMLSLSMVVVASMVGAEGLGQEVLRGITRLNVGQGMASGIGIVLLAMILDRLTRSRG